MHVFRRMKWNKTAIYALALAVLAGIFLLDSCKGYLIPDYELIITIEAGTAGTPEEGTYIYQEFDKIDYSYYSLDASIEIEVVVNGKRKGNEGTFTMYRDMDVVVRIIDIRGDWDLTFTKEGEEQKWVMTFSGADPFSGTFSDDRGYSGTWTVTGNAIAFAYTDWLGHAFTGVLRDMNGNWTSDGGYSGTWTAFRIL